MYILSFFDFPDTHQLNQIYITAKIAEDAEKKREMNVNDLNVISIFAFISAPSSISARDANPQIYRPPDQSRFVATSEQRAP
jgi:hypothetical protein